MSHREPNDNNAPDHTPNRKPSRPAKPKRTPPQTPDQYQPNAKDGQHNAFNYHTEEMKEHDRPSERRLKPSKSELKQDAVRSSRQDGKRSTRDRSTDRERGTPKVFSSTPSSKAKRGTSPPPTPPRPRVVTNPASSVTREDSASDDHIQFSNDTGVGLPAAIVDDHYSINNTTTTSTDQNGDKHRTAGIPIPDINLGERPINEARKYSPPTIAAISGASYEGTPPSELETHRYAGYGSAADDAPPSRVQRYLGKLMAAVGYVPTHASPVRGGGTGTGHTPLLDGIRSTPELLNQDDPNAPNYHVNDDDDGFIVQQIPGNYTGSINGTASLHGDPVGMHGETDGEPNSRIKRAGKYTLATMISMLNYCKEHPLQTIFGIIMLLAAISLTFILVQVFLLTRVQVRHMTLKVDDLCQDNGIGWSSTVDVYNPSIFSVKISDAKVKIEQPSYLTSPMHVLTAAQSDGSGSDSNNTSTSNDAESTSLYTQLLLAFQNAYQRGDHDACDDMLALLGWVDMLLFNIDFVLPTPPPLPQSSTHPYIQSVIDTAKVAASNSSSNSSSSSSSAGTSSNQKRTEVYSSSAVDTLRRVYAYISLYNTNNSSGTVGNDTISGGLPAQAEDMFTLLQQDAQTLIGSPLQAEYYQQQSYAQHNPSGLMSKSTSQQVDWSILPGFDEYILKYEEILARKAESSTTSTSGGLQDEIQYLDLVKLEFSKPLNIGAGQTTLTLQESITVDDFPRLTRLIRRIVARLNKDLVESMALFPPSEDIFVNTDHTVYSHPLLAQSMVLHDQSPPVRPTTPTQSPTEHGDATVQGGITSDALDLNTIQDGLLLAYSRAYQHVRVSLDIPLTVEIGAIHVPFPFQKSLTINLPSIVNDIIYSVLGKEPVPNDLTDADDDADKMPTFFDHIMKNLLAGFNGTTISEMLKQAFGNIKFDWHTRYAPKPEDNFEKPLRTSSNPDHGLNEKTYIGRVSTFFDVIPTNVTLILPAIQLSLNTVDPTPFTSESLMAAMAAAAASNGPIGENDKIDTQFGECLVMYNPYSPSSLYASPAAYRLSDPPTVEDSRTQGASISEAQLQSINQRQAQKCQQYLATISNGGLSSTSTSASSVTSSMPPSTIVDTYDTYHQLIADGLTFRQRPLVTLQTSALEIGASGTVPQRRQFEVMVKLSSSNVNSIKSTVQHVFYNRDVQFQLSGTNNPAALPLVHPSAQYDEHGNLRAYNGQSLDSVYIDDIFSTITPLTAVSHPYGSDVTSGTLVDAVVDTVNAVVNDILPSSVRNTIDSVLETTPSSSSPSSLSNTGGPGQPERVNTNTITSSIVRDVVDHIFPGAGGPGPAASTLPSRSPTGVPAGTLAAALQKRMATMSISGAAAGQRLFEHMATPSSNSHPTDEGDGQQQPDLIEDMLSFFAAVVNERGGASRDADGDITNGTCESSTMNPFGHTGDCHSSNLAQQRHHQTFAIDDSDLQNVQPPIAMNKQCFLQRILNHIAVSYQLHPAEEFRGESIIRVKQFKLRRLMMSKETMGPLPEPSSRAARTMAGHPTVLSTTATARDSATALHGHHMNTMSLPTSTPGFAAYELSEFTGGEVTSTSLASAPRVQLSEEKQDHIDEIYSRFSLQHRWIHYNNALYKSQQHPAYSDNHTPLSRFLTLTLLPILGQLAPTSGTTSGEESGVGKVIKNLTHALLTSPAPLYHLSTTTTVVFQTNLLPVGRDLYIPSQRYYLQFKDQLLGVVIIDAIHIYTTDPKTNQRNKDQSYDLVVDILWNDDLNHSAIVLLELLRGNGSTFKIISAQSDIEIPLSLQHLPIDELKNGRLISLTSTFNSITPYIADILTSLARSSLNALGGEITKTLRKIRVEKLNGRQLRVDVPLQWPFNFDLVLMDAFIRLSIPQTSHIIKQADDDARVNSTRVYNKPLTAAGAGGGASPAASSTPGAGTATPNAGAPASSGGNTAPGLLPSGPLPRPFSVQSVSGTSGSPQDHKEEGYNTQYVEHMQSVLHGDDLLLFNQVFLTQQQQHDGTRVTRPFQPVVVMRREQHAGHITTDEHAGDVIYQQTAHVVQQTAGQHRISDIVQDDATLDQQQHTMDTMQSGMNGLSSLISGVLNLLGPGGAGGGLPPLSSSTTTPNSSSTTNGSTNSNNSNANTNNNSGNSGNTGGGSSVDGLSNLTDLSDMTSTITIDEELQFINFNAVNQTKTSVQPIQITVGDFVQILNGKTPSSSSSPKPGVGDTHDPMQLLSLPLKDIRNINDLVISVKHTPSFTSLMLPISERETVLDIVCPALSSTSTSTNWDQLLSRCFLSNDDEGPEHIAQRIKIIEQVNGVRVLSLTSSSNGNNPPFPNQPLNSNGGGSLMPSTSGNLHLQPGSSEGDLKTLDLVSLSFPTMSPVRLTRYPQQQQYLPLLLTYNNNRYSTNFLKNVVMGNDANFYTSIFSAFYVDSPLPPPPRSEIDGSTENETIRALGDKKYQTVSLNNINIQLRGHNYFSDILHDIKMKATINNVDLFSQTCVATVDITGLLSPVPHLDADLHNIGLELWMYDEVGVPFLFPPITKDPLYLGEIAVIHGIRDPETDDGSPDVIPGTDGNGDATLESPTSTPAATPAANTNTGGLPPPGPPLPPGAPGSNPTATSGGAGAGAGAMLSSFSSLLTNAINEVMGPALSMDAGTTRGNRNGGGASSSSPTATAETSMANRFDLQQFDAHNEDDTKSTVQRTPDRPIYARMRISGFETCLRLVNLIFMQGQLTTDIMNLRFTVQLPTTQTTPEESTPASASPTLEHPNSFDIRLDIHNATIPLPKV